MDQNETNYWKYDSVISPSESMSTHYLDLQQRIKSKHVFENIGNHLISKKVSISSIHCYNKWLETSYRVAKDNQKARVACDIIFLGTLLTLNLQKDA